MVLFQHRRRLRPNRKHPRFFTETVCDAGCAYSGVVIIGAARALDGADGSALPAAPPRAIETRRGYVARVSQAPGFILTAPAAVAQRAAMAVRTAVAQGERRRSRR